MQGQGFAKVHNLKGGIKAWNGMKASGPAEQGMGLLSGGEGPAQVLAVAHALEKNLGDFYRDLADRAPSQEAQEAFGRLAGAEDKHRASIEEAFQAETGRDRPPEVEAGSMLEGGLEPEDLLQRFSEVQGPTQTLYQMAMELEAQALDLYLRYGQVMTTDQSRATFHHLADEEKTHLAWLGRMLEQAV